ncbi:transglycosylase domain-containing protein [Nocardioides sp. 31GB23]|uniref:transglycosylase domain-containing protein n=1 Tax=Nocardioides sp. 31GB23 TaxID=3156065 RepID=UPI0032AFB9FF
MTAKRRAAGPAVKKTPKKKTPRTWKQRSLSVLKWGSIAGVVGVLLAAGGFFYLYQSTDIPDPNAEFETETTFVYYADGKTEAGRFATQDRTSISYDEMPDSIKDAVVAAENQSFWSDSGLDPKGIARAFFNNAAGDDTQGASTITQQYVKVLYLTQERSYERKVKEAILALKLHRQQSKTEILQGYLNTIYFGRGAYGVQAAAQAYFDKDAADMNLRQSAVLASVLNNPSRFDPAGGKDSKQALKGRYAYVLSQMEKLETITPEAAEKAVKRLPKFPKIQAQSTYGGQKGHVLEMVRDELNRLGFSDDEIDGGGLRVTTTFTEDAMTAAEEGVLEARPEGFGDKQLHVGVASVEPGSGAVRGFYGGQDYVQSQYNWAVTGGQAGSTLKAFALAAAIKEGFSLRDTFDGNSPYELPDGTEIENQGDSSYGSAIDMVYATQKSANSAFIDMTLAMDKGPQKILDMANAMGIPPGEAGKNAAGIPPTSPGLEPITGIALGNATVSPINMANAYATIANEGVYSEPYVVEEVVGADGEVEYTHEESTERAVGADIAADVSYALQQNVTGGSGTAALALGRPAAGKTGTATNGRGEVSSAWFAGYTPQMSTAVMYVRGKGNEQLQGWLPEYFGGAYPADTWLAVMSDLMEGLEVEEFPEPVFVDGEAPPGYEPTTAPPTPSSPQPTQQSPTKQPSPTQEPSPTEEPTTEAPTPTPSPSETCDGLLCGPSGSSSPSSSPTSSPSSSGGAAGGGGGTSGPSPSPSGRPDDAATAGRRRTQ